MARHIGIVIGMDRLGKTALVEMMANADPTVETLHLNLDPRTLGYGQSLIWAARQTVDWDDPVMHWKTLIYDRFPYPDEMVYGIALQEKRLRETWELLCAEFEVKIVYVEGPDAISDYMQIVAKDPDEYYGNMGSIVYKALHAYKAFLKETKLPVLRVKHKYFTSLDARRILDFIQGRVDKDGQILTDSTAPTLPDTSTGVPVRIIPLTPRSRSTPAT
jgi:hypothetical protein